MQSEGSTVGLSGQQRGYIADTPKLDDSRFPLAAR
jgi:hypothetical protein